MKILLKLTKFSTILIFVFCENESQTTGGEMQNEESESLNDQWQQEIKELMEKLIAAMRDGNLDLIMSCLWNSPNFIMITSNGNILQGWDNMRADTEQFINSTEWREISLESRKSFRHDNEIYTVGTAKWKFQLKDGPLVEFREVWTDVSKRINGNLVYILNHAHDLTPFTP